jgi:tetratricopeptide (TPR) repeat protein
MFEVIFGKVPFEQINPAKLLYQRMHDDPVELFNAPDAPAVSAGLKSLLLKGLARQTEHRYQSAEAMLEALNNLAAADLDWHSESKKQSHKLSFVPLIATSVFVASFLLVWHFAVPQMVTPPETDFLVRVDKQEIDACFQKAKDLAADPDKIPEASALLKRAYALAVRNKDVDRQVEITRFELGFQRDKLKDPKGEIACAKRLIELAKRYVSSNGLHFESKEWLARTLADDGQTEEAIATMQAAIASRMLSQSNSGIRPSVHDRNQVAVWYNKLHKVDKAREQLEHNWLIQENLKGGNPEDAATMVESVRLVAALGEPEKARERMKHLVKVIPPLMVATEPQPSDIPKVYNAAIEACQTLNLPREKAEFEKAFKDLQSATRQNSTLR